MRKLSLKALMAMAAAGACVALPAFADDDGSRVGVAHVYRSREPARLDTPDAVAKSDQPAGAKSTRASQVRPVDYAEKSEKAPPPPAPAPGGKAAAPAPGAHGAAAPDLHPANCPNGCPDECCDHGCCLSGLCHDACCPKQPVRFFSPLEVWLVGDFNAKTYPPDYGWSRPVKRPILNRVPVSYYQMDPQYWTGDPRAFQNAPQFPIVYMPTDTTQLGYTYQRVWQWQPNPNMLPAPPWPATWHRRECPEFAARQRAEMIAAAGGATCCGDVGYYGHPGGPVAGHPVADAKAPAAKSPAKPAPKADLPPGEKLPAAGPEPK